MTDFIIAYANDSTNYAWTICGKSYTLDSARKSARTWSTTSMKNSAVAVFRNRDGWQDRKPYIVCNRHVLAQRGNIRLALGGLINSLESDWF